MFARFCLNRKRIYPILVVSTMSSGKSTLINALLGTDLLPSRNRACTAKALPILGNHAKPRFELHMIDKEGKYRFFPQAAKTEISRFNQTREGAEMILTGAIPEIYNSRKSILLLDTPGINNSMEQSHERVTKEVLKEYSEGLILYVMNAQQIGTYDDRHFLDFVVKQLADNPKLQIIFAINKMDLVDPAREKLEELLENCRQYLKARGIEDPVLLPVSAGSALVFQKALQGEMLSELEEEDLVRNYRHFKREGFSLADYASIPGRGGAADVFTIDGTDYTRAGLSGALENTGIPLLKKTINEIFLRSLKMRSPGIKKERVKNG